MSETRVLILQCMHYISLSCVVIASLPSHMRNSLATSTSSNCIRMWMQLPHVLHMHSLRLLTCH